MELTPKQNMENWTRDYLLHVGLNGTTKKEYLNFAKLWAKTYGYKGDIWKEIFMDMRKSSFQFIVTQKGKPGRYFWRAVVEGWVGN